MMSEYYDHYHRWEPLAEFHFKIGDGDDCDEESYVYCLCSRAFIRDGVKTYYVDKEEGSESDVEVIRDSHSQECDEHSHVHFSLDTSYKVKCEKDEGASCYCSASHTDNYCSTDEHDPAQIQSTVSHALQPSDSGADLTYQDCHSDFTTQPDQLEKMEQDFALQNSKENYFSENTWEKFWAVNGERLIWASWIEKYSDYINPSYLDTNNDLLTDDNNLPKQRSADQIYKDQPGDGNKKNEDDDSMRERKFSYDSKVNPYKNNKSHPDPSDKAEETESRNRDDPWLPLARKRSCSEHDRILSPRTVTGTDSMTNVTKITMSSFDRSSSHVTSESSPTDDYSMSSSTSDDQSNDQTRIANIDQNLENPLSEELDTDQYWQFLWKKHFGEQFALHYANYLERHVELENKNEEFQKNEPKDVPVINIPEVPVNTEKHEEKVEVECENSEGNSQETPTVIEVVAQVNNISIEDKNVKPKKRIKKNTNRVINSVGMLLQTLLKDEQKKNDLSDVNESVESEDGNNKAETVTADAVDRTTASGNKQQLISNTNLKSYSYDDGDDEPPKDKPVTLKRSHEIDEEAIAEEVTNTFDVMGFCVNPENMPKGQLIYKKRVARLRPRHKRFGAPKKTYFDDEGNPYQAQESQDEREMQTDDEGHDEKSTDIPNLDEKSTDIPNIDATEAANTRETNDTESEEAKVTREAAGMPLPSDMSGSFSSVQENSDENKGNQSSVEPTKRKRRPKRHRAGDIDDSEIPVELRETPKMLKYWKKRHSLFHRFDEGIKLDLESWFSVTPESVAWHIANKFTYDVVIDAFCGAGGNTIQFAKTSKKVIAIDIDPNKIEIARHNATVYGVVDRIQFMVGDFFELAQQLEGDMVFLSPPWGGPKYSENYEYDIETMLAPKPASELMNVARNITTNIALYLPRNSKSDQIISIAKEIGSSVEVEQSYLDKRFVAITAYFYQNEDL